VTARLQPILNALREVFGFGLEVRGITRRVEFGRVAQASLFFLPVPEPWVPRPCVLCKGGRRCCLYYFGCHATRLASNLRRPSPALYHLLVLLPFLRATRTRDRFLSILEETRQRYTFVVVGYVVMPEHIHLLITEPEVGTPSTVIQVLKQRSARALLLKKKRADARQRRLFGDTSLRTPFWQARFYDFNVWTTKKRVDKLSYMHRNPVKRGLAGSPKEWRWSSYGFYLLEETGPVRDEDFVSASRGVTDPTCASLSDGASTVVVMPKRSQARTENRENRRRDVHRFLFQEASLPVPFSFCTVFFHNLPQKKIHCL